MISWFKIDGLRTENKKVYLSWEQFDEMVKQFSNKICSLPDPDKLCLLGVARGGLPLLTAVSHQTGIRNISIVQTQITNTDTPFDYGNIRLLIDGIRDEFDKFIVLEDIIGTGETLKFLLRYLQKKGKSISSIFSLVIDEDFLNSSEIDVPIYGGVKLPSKNWVVFPWERSI